MDTTTLDFNTLALLVAILGSTVGSTLTLVTLIVRQSNRQDTKFTGRIDDLDTRLTGRIDDLDTKFTGKIDSLQDGVTDGRERLARIEGYLMAPGRFKARGLDPPGPSEPSPGNPDTDHRAAS